VAITLPREMGKILIATAGLFPLIFSNLLEAPLKDAIAS